VAGRSQELTAYNPLVRLLLLLALSLPLLQLPRTANPADRGLTEADFPRVQQIAPDVYTYEQLRSAGRERFTTVSLFVVTPNGVLVADGQGSVAETARLVEAIRRITPTPITHVVIGSDHGDHTAGNAAFPHDAITYAHPTSIRQLQRGPSGVVPQTLTPVTDRTVVRLGDMTIEVLFLGRAHTGGDLSVYLPREKVLFMSEAYLHRVFPAMRSAYPSEWVRTIERAQALDVTTYVPGHGFVDPPDRLKEELDVFRRALVTVIDEGRRLHVANVPIDDAITQARFGDLETWSLRSSQAATAIRRVYAELNGELR
jgi:glyoxylase-like metal-dependent hydrolase (beta-lactamase superfamily II)